MFLASRSRLAVWRPELVFSAMGVAAPMRRTPASIRYVIMTREFLDFSFRKGNDLITPRPQWDFPGLKPGDRWCLCAQRWMEAYRAGVAPSVVLEATHEKMLLFISLSELTKFAYRAPRPEIS